MTECLKCFGTGLVTIKGKELICKLCLGTGQLEEVENIIPVVEEPVVEEPVVEEPVVEEKPKKKKSFFSKK